MLLAVLSIFNQDVYYVEYLRLCLIILILVASLLRFRKSLSKWIALFNVGNLVNWKIN